MIASGPDHYAHVREKILQVIDTYFLKVSQGEKENSLQEGPALKQWL